MMKGLGENITALNSEAVEANDATAFRLAIIFLTLGFALTAFAYIYWSIDQTLMLTSGLIGLALGFWNLRQYLHSSEEPVSPARLPS